MITPGTKVALIDSAIHKGLINNLFDILAHLVHSEHVIEGVVVIFQPKITCFLYVVDRLFRDIYAIMI